MRIVRLVAVLASVLLPVAAIAQTPAPLLVDAAWLAQHINDRNLVVLHVDDEPEYKGGHIPGARYLTMQSVSKMPSPDSPLVLELLAPEELRTRLQNLGIADDSRIVVYYGRNGAFPSATRVVLTLDYIGLGGQTSILNGGVGSWTRAGQTLTPAVPAITPGRLTARAVKGVVVDASYVQSVVQKTVQKPAHILVDGRAPVFYTGINETYGGSGHIPGAVNIPFTEILDSTLMVDQARIEKLFRAAGVKPGDTVVAYCHIGQQGTAVVFGARLLGHPVVLYDGSMQDWGTNKRGPVVK
jgi:thiosulfate/3-mercaptopyruvate sulfurtransferase